MNIRRLSALTLYILAIVGARAELNVESVVREAASDPKRAPGIVAVAVAENPQSLLPMVSAAVAGLPEQAVEIVRAILLSAPEQYASILRAAIAAQPALALDFATMAAELLPESVDDIVKVALEAAPEGARREIAALTKRSQIMQRRSGSSARPTSFPLQPILADLKSNSA